MEVGLFTVVKKVIEPPPGSGGTFDVSLRLVFDQRVPNEMWRAPPWVPLAGPGAFASLDPQWPADRPATFGFATGDVPNFYFCLQLPPEFSSYFVLPGVRIPQLTAELRALGDEALADRLEAEGGSNGFLGMAVPVMGWSWAVFLANSLLMDLLATVPSGAATFDLSRLLVEGAKSPTISPEQPDVFFVYIDDFGIVKMFCQDEDWAILRGLAASVKAVLESAGLAVHKEEFGSQLCVLGLLL